METEKSWKVTSLVPSWLSWHYLLLKLPGTSIIFPCYPGISSLPATQSILFCTCFLFSPIIFFTSLNLERNEQMEFFPDTFILLFTSPLKYYPSLFLSILFSFCLLRFTSFPNLCCFTSSPSSPTDLLLLLCGQQWDDLLLLKQQLCLAPGSWGASQPQGFAPSVPFGTNILCIPKPAGDSSQVWCWWWWGSGQCKFPALFLIPKARRNGASQKLPLNHLEKAVNSGRVSSNPTCLQCLVPCNSSKHPVDRQLSCGSGTLPVKAFPGTNKSDQTVSEPKANVCFNIYRHNLIQRSCLWNT